MFLPTPCSRARARVLSWVEPAGLVGRVASTHRPTRSASERGLRRRAGAISRPRPISSALARRRHVGTVRRCNQRRGALAFTECPFAPLRIILARSTTYCGVDPARIRCPRRIISHPTRPPADFFMTSTPPSHLAPPGTYLRDTILAPDRGGLEYESAMMATRAARPLRDRAWILLAMNCGFRIREIRSLNLPEVWDTGLVKAFLWRSAASCFIDVPATSITAAAQSLRTVDAEYWSGRDRAFSRTVRI